MIRLVCSLPDDVVAVYRYHLTAAGKQSGKYLADLIVADLKKNRPEMMEKIKKETIRK